MIKSKFSKAILPLAVATVISGGCMVKSTTNKDKEPEAKEIAANNQSSPLQNPALMGTLFTLGLLGTAGAATLAKAVDIRYKDSKEKIEEIYDISTITEKDYSEAFEETCKELESKGEIFDKNELKEQFSPKTKEELINMIDNLKAHLKRVTDNCKQDKNSAADLYFLIEELKSAIMYGEIPENDDIKYKMLYKFEKATLPSKEWKAVETKYKAEHPNIDFDTPIGAFRESKLKYLTKSALNNYLSDKEIIVENTDDLRNPLMEIKQNLNITPKILTQYDRAECLKLIDNAIYYLDNVGNLPNGLFQQILTIYINKQQTYI